VAVTAGIIQHRAIVAVVAFERKPTKCLGAAVQDMMADLALMGTEAVGLGIAA
jgi:hypothetical protein